MLNNEYFFPLRKKDNKKKREGKEKKRRKKKKRKKEKGKALSQRIDEPAKNDAAYTCTSFLPV